jgi:NDP-sugar pyrophosphorylase family protein
MENAKICNNYNLDETIAKDYLAQYTYPWEALKGISEYIKELGPKLDKEIFEERGENIWVAKSAKVAPTACLNGPLIIDEDAEIRHCAYIRGSAIIGKNSVVGNSTEIKNDIIFNNVQVPHYNYVGDSILGYKAHMGAGSITSNVKSDKTLVVVKDCYDTKEEIATGLKKFGAMLGDYVEVGCNSVLNPGTVIGKNSSVYPTSCVRGVIPANHIFKEKNKVVKKV